MLLTRFSDNLLRDNQGCLTRPIFAAVVTLKQIYFYNVYHFELLQVTLYLKMGHAQLTWLSFKHDDF